MSSLPKRQRLVLLGLDRVAPQEGYNIWGSSAADGDGAVFEHCSLHKHRRNIPEHRETSEGTCASVQSSACDSPH